MPTMAFTANARKKKSAFLLEWRNYPLLDQDINGGV